MNNSFINLFENQVVKVPENIAVVFENEQITYKELDRRSNRLAQYLLSHKNTEGMLVPLFIERGINMIVGMLGIMKAGCAYVPIETDFPQERISYMLEDTKAIIAVSSKQESAGLSSNPGLSVIEIESVLSKQDDAFTSNVKTQELAYIIYTSGSTGKPKGVMVEQGNLVDYVEGLISKVQLDDCKSFALVSSIATDLGNTVIYGALATGGALHLFSKESVNNTDYLHRYFEQNSIECLKIVPSHWKALNDDHLLLPTKLIIFGGEALPEKIVETIRSSGSACRIVNHYGPTETTIGKLLFIVEPGIKYETTVPIGKPFSNTKVLILNSALKLCPIGVPGQLYITGDGLARGYLNNEELTNQKFIPNPFIKDGKSLMYATGDLVKYLSDGNIQFLGRVDDQVKIRGYRVELGEIESVIRESDLVKQAVVLGLDDKQGNKRLVAYVVGEQTFNREELLDYLREKLPDYMVPSVLVELESLPLAPNGKVDRKNLPDPDETEQKSDEYIAPRNATETQLAEIWQHVLEVDQVGINDDFFELGGHSLLAVRLISAIRKAFKAELPISDVFDYPTIAGQASQIELQLGAGKTAAELLPAISVNSRPLRIPLSYSQERLWFIDRLEGSLQYHVPTVLQLSGKLNIEALSSAIREVISRHEVLRTVIREEDGQAWQEIRGVKENILTLLDGNTIQPGELDSYIKQIIRKPFNLSEDMMLRAHLISLEPDEHVLVVTLHHIASDGWSRSILVSELVELYSSFTDQRKALLPPLPVQYADFALWQRSYLEGGVLQKKLNYWNEKLRNVSPLELPTDHTRPAVQGTQGSIIYFSIGAEVADSLQKLSQLHGATLYMTLLSAFKILLYRYSRQEDICVGSPIAGRQQQELEGLIGFFVNTLAMRSHLDSEMRFTELLEAVKNTTLEAYANQEIPFEKVVETVGNARDLSRNPLFQVMFILRNTPDVPELRLGDVALSRAAHEHTTSLFDLSLYLTETEFGLKGSLEYNTQLYEEATIERMIVHFKELLNSIIARPTEKIGSVKILSQLEEEALINFNVTDTVYPADTTLVKLFEQQVIDGNAIEAVVFGDSKLTYGELNIQANQLAHFLIQNGLEPGGLVPLCIERSLNMIIGILGILKAGGVYVPIDPEYPLERIRFMLEDTEATLILSSIASRSKLGDTSFAKVIEVDGAHSETISAKPVANPQISARDEQLVYVIYTSGSTGKPKGVQMPEKGMINLLYWQEQQFVNQHRHVLQFASITFDVSFQEIFSTLCFGSTLYLIEENRRKDMAAMLEDIARYKISHLFIPYIVLKSLVETAGTLTNLSTLPEEIIVAGEQLKLTDDIRAMITRAGVKLVNQYGPTEAHVVSCYRLEGESLPALPPIGKPIANTKLYVVDGQGALCPIGIPGELYIGGVQVAKGYLNREELSSQKFVIDTFSAVEGARLYKTGDLARWLSDGNIEYLGRIDDQVKVRGYRIELGEIESVLQQSRLVRQGVILDSEDSNGNKRLVGYAVAENNRIFDKDAVIEYLKNRLPEYMVPTLWVELDSMPITANGKVDKRALPAPDLSQLGSREYTAPSTEMEHKLAAIWQELLGVERISVHDNFFELGGHSLMAMKVVSQIKNKLSLTVPIQSIFQFPSIYELSNYLEMSEDEDTASFEEIII